jgi:hypothetical protein
VADQAGQHRQHQQQHGDQSGQRAAADFGTFAQRVGQLQPQVILRVYSV